MALKYVLFAAFLGIAFAQTELSVEDAINSLPPELQGKVDEKQFETIRNKSVVVAKEKCDKNGGPEAYAKVENAAKDFKNCLMTLVDTKVLQEEIEEAKPDGRVDEVFNKYCEKRPQLEKCFKNMTAAVEACLTPEERNNLKPVYNVTHQLIDFVCFKKGERIALFIAEHGPECLQEKQEAIQGCINKTMGYDLSQVDVNKDNLAEYLPRIEIGESECAKFNELQQCVARALGTCEHPTPANMVDSLFNFVRKATPCRDAAAQTKAKSPNSASGMFVRAATLASAAAAAIFL